MSAIYTCHDVVKILFSLNYDIYFVSADSVLDAILPKSLSQAQLFHFNVVTARNVWIHAVTYLG